MKAFPWLLALVALFFFPPATSPLLHGKWLALYGAGFYGAVYLLWPPRIFPRSSAKAIWLAAAVGCGFLAQLFYTRQEEFLFTLLDRSALLLAGLGAWKAFRRGLSLADFWLPASLAAFFGAATCLAGLGDPAGGFFGNPVAAAEALGALLLLAWAAGGPARERPFVARAFFGLVNALALFALVTRGGPVAFGIFAIAFFVLLGRAERLRFRGPGFAGLGVGLLLAVGFLTFGPGKGALPVYEPRAPLYKATFRMIGENPLGVGPGRFEFAALPYLRSAGIAAEGTSIASPRNELLRLLAEDGVPLVLGYLALLYLLLRAWLRGGRAERGWVRASLLFLALNAFREPSFHFAFTAGYGALVLAFVGAAGRVPPERDRAGPVTTACLVLGALAFLGLATVGKLSRIYEASDEAEFACRLAPETWRACLLAARQRQARGDWPGARVLIERVLAREPLNLSAIRQLTFVAGNQRRTIEACFLLWRYDDFYGEKSSEHARLEKNCLPKWLEYFRKRRPTRYYERSGRGELRPPQE